MTTNQEHDEATQAESEREDLKPEYQFDYTKAKPNRFAQQHADGSLVVILDPDIAHVFTTPESVKKVLRALIATMPPVSVSTEK
ncbi:MAG: hypothetical protein WCK70_05610 [Chloroflexales bacterium]|jgi:hypothetical protein